MFCHLFITGTGAVLSVLIGLIHYVSLGSHTPCRSKDCRVNQLLCKTGLLYIPVLYVRMLRRVCAHFKSADCVDAKKEQL